VVMGSLEYSDEVRQVLILGLGNPLLGDDGIGVRIIEEVKGLALPDGVTAIEGGTAGLDLIRLMEGYQRVIVVDAADLGHPPGDVVRFTPSDVRFHTADAPLSPHQIGLGEVLALAEALQVAPAELVIIGIQPSRIEAGLGLSPEVEGAIHKIIEIILDELKAANLHPAPA
jgi:hydrogenase maturation protease